MKSAAELSDCPSTDTTHQSWKVGAGFAAPMLSEAEPARPWTRTKLRIPRTDETVFARPDLGSAGELARANAESLNDPARTLQGLALSEFRRSARREILDLAQEYTADLLGQPVSDLAEGGLLFASGHQPSLYHPGVWIKNFAIDALARRAGGVGLNLVIDNDTLSSRQLRVPIGDRRQPGARTLDFDEPGPVLPWEDARIADFSRFESFGERIREAMDRWNITPVLSDVWPVAVAQAGRSSSLRDALTSARMSLEQRWGLSNLEVPLSRVCETKSFSWFTAAVLTRLPRFWEVYNSVLAEFRQVNRIRSQTHPVPVLDEADGWYEAPFWVWRAGDSVRIRVRAKACSQEVRLSDGREIFARLPISADGDVSAAAEILQELPKRGIRFRTRALTTTLFARLGLADLFVHGIGGAKYDEMTDRIISRFFGLPAPGFLTLSCTVHLPLGEPFPVSPEEEQTLRHRLRDLEWNPERYLPRGRDGELENLIAEQQALIAQKAAGGSSDPAEQRRQSRKNHDRHARLKEIRERLARETAEPRRHFEQELAAVREQLAANAILEDREFSFGLYPEEKLRPFLTGLLS